MAVLAQEIQENDVVELLDSVGRWPAGRIGAVVSDYGNVKLVEIADERGVMLDLVQIPLSLLKLVSKHSA